LISFENLFREKQMLNDFGQKIWVRINFLNTVFSNRYSNLNLDAVLLKRQKRGRGYRCTRVENPGEGVTPIFAKITGGGDGGQGFQ
jgi:hypothetical protein